MKLLLKYKVGFGVIVVLATILFMIPFRNESKVDDRLRLARERKTISDLRALLGAPLYDCNSVPAELRSEAALLGHSESKVFCEEAFLVQETPPIFLVAKYSVSNGVIVTITKKRS